MNVTVLVIHKICRIFVVCLYRPTSKGRCCTL